MIPRPELLKSCQKTHQGWRASLWSFEWTLCPPPMNHQEFWSNTHQQDKIPNLQFRAWNCWAKTFEVLKLFNFRGPMDSLPPPHDMCIKSNQEDKSPPSRPSDNGSAPACFQSLLEVQFSYYAHYQMTTTSSLSTISPSPSISFVFQDAHKQMRIIRFLHNL